MGSPSPPRRPRAYVASALSNSELNAKVTQALELHAWSCFLPQRDAPTSGDGRSISTANIEGILGSDVVVALSHNMGKDTAWEVGFAIGRGIPVVLVCPSAARAELDMMVFHSVATVVRTELDEAPSVLPALLDRWMAEAKEGRRE